MNCAKTNNRLFIGVVCSVLCVLSDSAAATWYNGKIAEVTIRSRDGVEAAYVRLDSNPNPANCGNAWAGAEWNGQGKSLNLTVGVALTAKSTGQPVRVHIDDVSCGSANWPQMDWIQIQ